jgi:hypothetical protein
MKLNTMPAPALPARRRLLLALPGSAFLASPLALIACGGGGSDGSSAPTSATVALQLPATVPTREVTLVSGSAETTASGTSVEVAMPGDTLALVSAVHSSDRVVALGLLRNGTAGQSIGARSSAEALLFLALGGMQLDTADRVRLLAAVRADARTTTLTQQVETLWATDPFALDGPDPALASAVAAAAAAMRTPPAAPAGARRRALADAAVQPLQRIEPSNEVAGVTVLQADGSDRAPGLRIQNTKRRRGIAHVYKVGYTPTGGAPFQLALADALYERIEVPATQAMGIFNVLGDIVSASAPWSPVETARYGMPMHAGAEQTVYELVYITPVHNRPEPAFFQEVRYSLARDVWRGELKTLFQAAQMELVFGAILEALGLGGGAIADATITEAIAALASQGTPSMVELLRQSGLGEAMLPGIRAWLLNVSEGNALVSGAYRVGVETLVRRADAQLASNIAAGNLSRARLTAFRGAVRVLLAVTVVAGVLDTAAQYRDLHEGEHGSLITSTLVAPKVQITPANARVQRGGELGLSARVTGAQNLTTRWKWTLAGSNLANLSDGAGNIGLSFETASDQVTLATTPSTVGTLTVTVECLVQRNGSSESLGTAVASVVVDTTAVTLSPTSAEIARTGGTKSFRLTVDPLPAAAAGMQVEWTCASLYGSLAAGGQTTAAAAPTLTGTATTAVYSGRNNNEGGTYETVRAVAFVMEGGVRRDLGSASAEVFIQQQYNVSITPADGDLPTDIALAVLAAVKEKLPAGATVQWSWSHGGVGTLTPPASGNAGSSQASVATGSSEGTMTLTAQAVISLPGGGTFRPLPATRAIQVKKGVKQLQFYATEAVFPCDTGCGVSDYTAFIVPLFANATNYKSEHSDPNGNVYRVENWIDTKPDRGGNYFPITRHPFPSGPAFWAVWTGFGGAPGAGYRCLITVTLRA